jgi:lysophospholipase L1-like esterase
MLELPLPPLANRYGQVQRRLAREFGVTLIPKRHLAAILSAPGATVDGLHLSASGHARMARMVGGFVAPLLSTNPAIAKPAS